MTIQLAKLRQADARHQFPEWVIHGKTLSEYILSELPQTADIIGTVDIELGQFL